MYGTYYKTDRQKYGFTDISQALLFEYKIAFSKANNDVMRFWISIRTFIWTLFKNVNTNDLNS